MRLRTFLLCLPILSQSSLATPHKRSYDTHHYFALSLPSSFDTLEEATAWLTTLSSLNSGDGGSKLDGLEVIERIGELDGEWLVRTSKSASQRPDFLESRERDLYPEETNDFIQRIIDSFNIAKSSFPTATSLSNSKRSHTTQHTPPQLRHLPIKLRSKRSSLVPSPPLLRHPSSFSPSSETYLSSLSQPHLRSPLPLSPPFPPSSLPQLHRRQDQSEPLPNILELESVQNPPLLLQDPLLPTQWHLINTLMAENSLNVSGLWERGVNGGPSEFISKRGQEGAENVRMGRRGRERGDGESVKVVVVDDGLDLNSDDLAGNFYAEGSYDFNDHTELPLPRLSDDQHGTRCAGEISAVANDVCGVGVAFQSKIAGVRILSAPISDADEAAALNYEYQKNEIYSCSWGPPDDGRSMEAPEDLILKALVNGVQQGRDGKGSIFVFAAGNGGGLDDQCNFDGYTNSIFSLTIGAMDRKGLHPYYSEMCAAMLAVAPSSGSGDHIHTTDVGKDRCTDAHGGTSAAAPLAAGVVALILQQRPDLTWRDIQHLMVRNSVFFNSDDPDWEKTSAGRMFSYKYGYGKIDAGLLVEAAEEWVNVKPQAWFDSPAIFLESQDNGSKKRETKRQEIGAELEEITEPEIGFGNGDGDGTGEMVPVEGSENDFPTEIEQPSPPPPDPGRLITEEGVASTFTITQQMLDDLNFERLEHVTVRVWIQHQRRGDVEVELKSPGGVTSVLARQRRFDEADSGFNGWKFMSMKHWDENPVGDWTITVKDRINPDKTGHFKSWSLQLWGEAVDASLARLWSPANSGEPDEEQVGSEPTGTGGVSQKPKPTEHLPGDHGSAEGESDQPGLAEPSPLPGSSNSDQAETGNIDAGGQEDIVEGGDEDGSPGEVSADEGYFSGIEKLAMNSLWIIVAAAGVIVAAIGTGFLLCLRSRRKRRMFRDVNGAERGEYQPVNDSMPMGILKRGTNGAGNGESKELYNAFGDESDEDDEDDSNERTGLQYHDSFLDDEDGQGDSMEKTGGGVGADDHPERLYRDEPDQGEGDNRAGSSGSGSGNSSWADAAEERQ